MISLILPYWNRKQSANKAFESLEKCYAGMDLEVVVVDDGSKIPYGLPRRMIVQLHLDMLVFFLCYGNANHFLQDTTLLQVHNHSCFLVTQPIPAI